MMGQDKMIIDVCVNMRVPNFNRCSSIQGFVSLSHGAYFDSFDKNDVISRAR